jgi:hypothetical protein
MGRATRTAAADVRCLLHAPSARTRIRSALTTPAAAAATPDALPPAHCADPASRKPAPDPVAAAPRQCFAT